MSGTPWVTVAGEALIDLVPGTGTDAFVARPGGSPFNVAVGLARLGTSTSLLARLADNAFGRMLRDHAAAEGIDLSTAPHAIEPTTLAVVSLDAQRQASYDFYVDGTADWQWTAAEIARMRPDTRVLHLGSIASWTPPGSEQLQALADRLHNAGDVLVSHDPNVRPLLLGEPARAREIIERSIGSSHVVKASRDDVEWLYPSIGLDHVGARWVELGASLVILTDGSQGAVAYRPDALALPRPGLTVDVADTVGAGDAFTAGFLNGLVRRGLEHPSSLATLSDGTLADLMDDAVLVSALTCRKVGADPPRLNLAELVAPESRLLENDLVP